MADSLVLLVTVFAIFIPALVLPGPDFVAVVRTSMTRGPAAGIKTAFGVATGLGFYAALSLMGLSALLVEMQWMALAVRVLGGAYLIFLGIRLLLAKPEMSLPDDEALPRRRSAYLFGFLVTLTNPKAIVLFASVFATAVTPQTPVSLLCTMIALVFAVSAGWYVIVSLFMSSPPVMRRFAGARHWIERAAGACFVAIGGKVMADARNPIA